VVQEQIDYLISNLDYNPDTGEFTWVKLGGFNRGNGKLQSVDGRGYRQLSTPWGKNIKLHRLAWFFIYRVWPDMQLDHINGIRTDNRIVNLRLVTQEQNSANSKPHRDNLYSTYKGVSFDKRQSKYIARLKGKFLGYYSAEKDAALAYDKAAKNLWGEYAKLNFEVFYEPR
jgi:hypothetical protein